MTAGLLFVFLALCGVCYSEVTVSFGGNDTLAASDSRFSFRDTQFAEISIDTLIGSAGAAAYLSTQVSGSGTNSNGGSATFNANGIVGLTYVANILDIVTCPPTLLMAFFNVSGSASGFSQTQTPWSASLSESVTAVGKVFYSLTEINPSGTIVNTVLLQDLTWNVGKPQTVDATKGLSTLAMTASLGSSGSITITYAVSSVVGVLNPGNVVVTPTSIESFIEIQGYSYASSSNYLNLTIYVAYISESAVLTGTATTLTTSSTGPDQIYVNFQGTATVNGNTQGVSVSGLADVVETSTLPGYFTGQLETHGSLSASARQVQISFPAGASDITYDPSVGFGAPPGAGSSALSGGAIAGIVIGVIVFVALVVGVVALVVVKGKGKKKGWF